MTDILEPIKAKILRFPSQAIMFTLEEVEPLITTIESQKEEIASLQKWNEEMKDCLNFYQDNYERG